LTERGYEQGQPEYQSEARQQADDFEGAAAAYARPAHQAVSSKGFIGSLFDFGFDSLVTPKVIKVLYVLIMILLALGGLGLAAAAFSLSVVAGIFALLIVVPLVFLIYLALWRVVLEVFMVIFRISEDLRIIRDHGGFR
jgi:hypothetical protein